MTSLNKPSLLVLGGTGFIGKRVINKAISKKWKVTCVSLSLPPLQKKIKKVKYLKFNNINITHKN